MERELLTSKALALLDLTDQEKASITVLIDFLKENPSELGWRGKNVPDINTTDGQIRIIERFIDGLRKKVVPSKPSTVPDNMVSEVLVSYYRYPFDRIDNMKTEHQHAMLAENTVGNLLEKYISLEASKFGWVHCVSELVKKVDFIKRDENSWLLLQIKNRDNSENSSSSAIRKGTEIRKWFRTFSRTGKTNWDKFPDNNLQKSLSEEGFIKFVRSYYAN